MLWSSLVSRALQIARQNKAKVQTICLTSDTTGQRTVEPEGLHDVPCVPCVINEHIHI